MTTVISPLLKPHITRFSGSRGSGTDRGRTTVSARDGRTIVLPAEPAVTVEGACAWELVTRLPPSTRVRALRLKGKCLMIHIGHADPSGGIRRSCRCLF